MSLEKDTNEKTMLIAPPPQRRRSNIALPKPRCRPIKKDTSILFCPMNRPRTACLALCICQRREPVIITGDICRRQIDIPPCHLHGGVAENLLQLELVAVVPDVIEREGMPQAVDIMLFYATAQAVTLECTPQTTSCQLLVANAWKQVFIFFCFIAPFSDIFLQDRSKRI